MENTLEMQQQEESSVRGRRSALLMGGAALAGLALTRRASAQAAAVTDNDILNFALNSEFLEAQFYTLATTGLTIDNAKFGSVITSGATPSVAGGTVSVKANAGVTFTSPLVQAIATETATEERNHIKFLQTALGAAAVAMPNIDLLASFNALSLAAGLGPTFDPFANQTNFLLGAFTFVDVGVTAYHGAAPLLSSSTNLDAAAGILAVEAYHAGTIRAQIYAANAAREMVNGFPIGQASVMIANARAKLSGATPADDIGVTTQAGPSSQVPGLESTVVDADANAIAFARTTTQVLNILYGGGKAGVGGSFFPNGLNGTIK